MNEFPKANRILLVILDGWGYSEEKEYNAIYKADTSNFDSLKSKYPYSLIEASGQAVGLPEGQMGNSEVGHLTMGAGRIVYQPLVRINNSIEEGDFFRNEEFLKAIRLVKTNESTLHLLGLTSPGGVHSHQNHLKALIKMALDNGVERIRIHAVTDGRDVPPRSSVNDIAALSKWIDEIGGSEKAKIATVMGRFYAMDRDKRWDRTKKAFSYYVQPEENRSDDPVEYIKSQYDEDITDEFLEPVQISDSKGDPLGLVNESDAVIFFNFRPDRARQITKAFIYPFFSGFVRPKVVKPYFVAMMDYDRSVFTHVAFPEQEINKPLGEILSEAGKTQLRIAETEKYAHVTFFFSGGTEDKYPGESRILVPSPKVRTYDLKPEMSANEITDKVITELGERSFDVGILNFANSDMVGHSGILEAAVKAVETVDDCLGRVVKTAIDSGYHVMITADHGNSEKLWDYENDSPHTAHTNNPVPFIYVAKEIDSSLKIRSGDKGLSDIAPTILYQLRMPTPRVMEGEPLTRA